MVNADWQILPHDAGTLSPKVMNREQLKKLLKC